MLEYPSFIIIGAYKSGTTALYQYLNQHPDIYLTPTKETNFFALEGQDLAFNGPGDAQSQTTKQSVTTLENYKKQFAGVTQEIATGEVSPLYLYSPRAAGAIAHHRPDTKLIALLRDPAERAFANFVHLVREKRETWNNLEHAFNHESVRIAKNWSPIWHLKSLGLYYGQLQRYFEKFPKKQIKIFLYEDFLTTPEKTIEEIFQFIDVDDTFRPDMSIWHNQSRLDIDRPLINLFRSQVIDPLQQKSGWKKDLAEAVEYRLTYKPRIPDRAKAEFSAFYREDVLRLQDLIERDLSRWLVTK